MRRRLTWIASALLLASACTSADDDRNLTFWSASSLGEADDEGDDAEEGESDDGESDDGESDDGMALPDMGGMDTGDADTGDTDTGPGDDMPPLQQCEYLSTDYDGALQVLDAPVGSDARLTFEILGLPDPSLVESAVLHFDSYDADHPGEEGMVWVNGAGPYDLPANAGWDNMNGTGTIDVSGTTIDGTNLVEFGPGTLQPSSWYHIGKVRLVVDAHVDSCEVPMDPNDPNAVERELWYDEAAYEQAHNWVIRCAQNFEYAFTAYGDEHFASDCSGNYNPDGSRTGRAIFHFPDVASANYEIQIHSRHTVNRNPAGALFVVDGIGKRIPQNDDQDFTTDIWGTKWLEGDIDVVLDSTMENASDSVTWVKIVPVG